MVSVALAEALRSAVRMVEPLLPSGAVFELAIDDGLPEIRGDPGQLQQVFRNLLVNAVEASAAGAVIRVQATRVAQTGSIRCVVADEGAGIAPELVDRLFEPFFGTKARSRGLGLADAERILDAHDGRISVESEPGAGARFVVDLPVPGSASTSSMASAAPLRTALVVDDEAVIRMLTERMLTDAGWRVLTAVNGDDGLTCWLSNRDEISVVLLDLKMPVLDGYGCLAGIRAEDPELPVLVLSGLVTAGEQASTLADDPHVGVLSKPFRRRDLEAAIAGL